MINPNDRLVFKLFSCCVLEEGYTGNVILDFQRKRIKYIPQTLYQILIEFKNKNIHEIKAYFNFERDAIIDEYFTFLYENEFGFYCSKNEISLFPEINFSYEYPSVITNAIVDFIQDHELNFANVFEKLFGLNCSNIQIRFVDMCKKEEMVEILKLTKKYEFNSIEIIIPYQDWISKAYLKMLLVRYAVVKIDIYNCPDGKCLLQEYVQPHSGGMDTISNSGEKDMFNLSVLFYSEAKTHNPYFNRKLFIDGKGEIRNSPECKVTFGNIQKIQKIEKVILSNAFQKKWFITKDMIDVCKDCEFRSICIGGKNILQRTAKEWYYLEECQFNPYISKWKGEEGFVSLADCGVKRVNGKFTINKRKIKALNQQIWG